VRDLIEYIITLLPQYFMDFGMVFAFPKTFIDAENIKIEQSFRRSLIFLALSLSIVVVMMAPLLGPGKDLWTYIGAHAVSVMLATVLGAVVLRVSWWLVGGRAPLRDFFVVYAYFFGVMFVTLTVALLLNMGVVKFFAPEIYHPLLDTLVNQKPVPEFVLANVWFRVWLLIGVVSYFWLFIWTIIGWGAYRKLNGLTRIRSCGAYLIAAFLFWPAAAFVLFVNFAMIQ
jgi:hypothetical protein